MRYVRSSTRSKANPLVGLTETSKVMQEPYSEPSHLSKRYIYNFKHMLAFRFCGVLGEETG